jgi:hypothetical protein
MHRRTGAWTYRDTRQIQTDFVMIDNDSVLGALYGKKRTETGEVIDNELGIKSLSTYKLFFFLLLRVNGRTAQRCPAGYKLGEEEIREGTGLSLSALYRSMKELQQLGLIKRTKINGRTFATLSSHEFDIEQEESACHPRHALLPEESESACHTRHARTALQCPEKPLDCDPVKKDECVSPVTLYPIYQQRNNSPSSPAQREDRKIAKNESSEEPDSDFVGIAQTELRAATNTDDPKSAAWTSILRLLRKKDGMDGLHYRGYPMGKPRKKSTLLTWFEHAAKTLPAETEAPLPPKPDRVTKYRQVWGELFHQFGYVFDPSQTGHMRHTVGTGRRPFQNQNGIETWESMDGPSQMAILNEKMELAIEEYGRDWFEQGEF